MNRWIEVEGGNASAHFVYISRSGLCFGRAVCGRVLKGRPLVLAGEGARRCLACLRRDASAKTLMHTLLGDDDAKVKVLTQQDGQGKDACLALPSADDGGGK